MVSKSIGNSDEAKAHKEPRYKLMVYYKLYSPSLTYLLLLIAINSRRKNCTAILFYSMLKMYDPISRSIPAKAQDSVFIVDYWKTKLFLPLCM